MLTNHVALVADGVRVPLSELMKVTAALQKQVQRDFAPIWKADATVDAFATLKDVPHDYWPIIIKDKLDEPDAGGYHEDKNGQPYSLVLHDDEWPLSASHECLEMLADPFGRRMVAGTYHGKRVKYLVEICDPCEDIICTYKINGIMVSDFLTPHFFGPVTTSELRYCFSGKIKSPRTVLRGGYLSWMDPETGHWWQSTWFEGAAPAVADMGRMDAMNGNLRSMVDRSVALKKHELRAARVTH